MDKICWEQASLLESLTSEGARHSSCSGEVFARVAARVLVAVLAVLAAGLP